MEGLTDLTFAEVTSTRSISGAAFSLGSIRFDWSTSGARQWIPSRSYLRADLELTVDANTPLTLGDGVCLSEFGSNAGLFVGADISLESTRIDSLHSSYAVTSALIDRRQPQPSLASFGIKAGPTGSFRDRSRLMASGSSDSDVLDESAVPIELFETSLAIAVVSGVLTITATQTGTGPIGVLQPGDVVHIEGEQYTIGIGTPPTYSVTSATAREAVEATSRFVVYRPGAAARSNAGRAVQSFYIRPGLGFWSVDTPCGSGAWSLTLHPNSNYRVAACEAVSANRTFNLTVRDLRLFVCQANVPSIPRAIRLSFPTYSSVIRLLNGGSSSYAFSVPPSCTAVSVLIQGSAAGSRPDMPASRFHGEDDVALRVTDCSATLDGTRNPQQPFSLSHSATEDLLSQLWWASTAAQSDEAYLGSETYSQWLRRGPYIRFEFRRPSSARSTEMSVQLTVQGNVALGTNVAFIIESQRTTESSYDPSGQLTSVREASV